MVSFGIAGRICRRLRSYYQNWFQRRNHIFVHKGPCALNPASSCEYRHFDNADTIPKKVWDAIEFYGGTKASATDRRELSQSAIMWTAFVNNQLAGVLFSRQGRFFKHWFVPLHDEDIVLFRMRTYPEFRGQGVAPSLLCHAISRLLSSGNKIYVDCRVYNAPAIRCIEKAGFVRIATMKPLARDEAMG